MVYLKALLAGLAAFAVLSLLTIAANLLASSAGVRLLSSRVSVLGYVILLSFAVASWISRKGHDQGVTHVGFLALATGGFAGLACALGSNAPSFLPLPVVAGLSVISAQVFASSVRRSRPR
jgi:hypothetical protein